MICGCLPHQAMFVRRDLFEQIGGFDTHYRIHADYDWMLRAFTAEGVSICRTGRVVSSGRTRRRLGRLEEGADRSACNSECAAALHNEPEWMRRRVRAFQRAALEYRLLGRNPTSKGEVLIGVAHGPWPRRRQTPRSGSDDDLPVHFFTIVLNGEPFIRYHLEMMRQLPFRWHWHIVEGVAELTRDTAWVLRVAGGSTRCCR